MTEIEAMKIVPATCTEQMQVVSWDLIGGGSAFFSKL